MIELIIKINGEKLQFFDNVSLSTSIDAISSSFSFDTFYDVINYEFSKIEVLRDNIIIFTGKVFSKTVPNDNKPKPFNYQCYSTSGILEDCTIPLELYPLQSHNTTLKEIIEKICNYFEVIVKFDASAISDVNKKYTYEDQSPTTKVASIINKLCTEKNLIVTHNAKGELIITKSVIGNNAAPPILIKSNKSYNYRKFFNKYVVVGQKSFRGGSVREATATFEQIEEKRNTTKVLTSGDADSAQEQADSIKNDSYKSNKLKLDYHDYIANIGDIYEIEGVKLIANSMNYKYKAGLETCSVDLLNLKVYSR